MAEQEASQFTEQEEQSAQKFAETLDEFREELKQAKSLNSLANFISQMAEFPLSNKYPELRNENERKLFVLYQELEAYKNEVLSAIMRQNFQGEENNGETKQGMAEDRHNQEEQG